MLIQELHVSLQKEINNLELELIVAQILMLKLKSIVFEGIQEAQNSYSELYWFRKGVKKGSKSEFNLSSDGVLNFKVRLCVSNDEES